MCANNAYNKRGCPQFESRCKQNATLPKRKYKKNGYKCKMCGYSFCEACCTQCIHCNGIESKNCKSLSCRSGKVSKSIITGQTCNACRDYIAYRGVYKKIAPPVH